MLAITAIVSPLTEILYKPKIGTSDKHQNMRTIQTMPRVSEFRIISCVHSEENVPSMISLLEAFNPTEVTPICAYVIHLMELVGRAAPLLIHLNKRKRRSFMRFANSYGSNPEHILCYFENYAMNSSGRVTVHPLMMIAPYKGMHGNICSLAKDTLAPLIIVPYHENQRAIQGNRIATAIRDLNTNIQTYAPCTVGVLVDRGLRTRSCSHFSYHIAVVFIGGQDDREALACAARMSGHAGVSVMVMRIILRDKKWESDDEKLDIFLDDTMFDELKMKSIIDECVVCREVVVEDSVAVVDAILSLECIYDLVMVGRRHRAMVVRDVEMPAFVEHEDLGLIGDVLASTNFNGSWLSVLVLRSVFKL